MASSSKCRFCGAVVRSDEKNCPNCGATNENYVPDTPRTVFLPKTIEELKEYCAERGMPLQRMRFFIDEDFREPRAFGIYRDGDNFVVYKNKSNGNRSERYHGPDEAYAVGELFEKMIEECHNRGIYPDGKPDTPPETPTRHVGQIRSGKHMLGIILVVILGIMMAAIVIRITMHLHDGYYHFSNNDYYRYGEDWYSYDTWSDNWTHVPTVDEPENLSDYFVAEDTFESDWDGTSFRDSATWDAIQESNSGSSSDYDDWDFGGTDWDSDW